MKKPVLHLARVPSDPKKLRQKPFSLHGLAAKVREVLNES
jgi:hypothetical protein